MKKLYKNKNIIAILTTLSLATFLNACTPSKEKKEETNQEQVSQILDYYESEEQNDEIKEETSDKEIKEYINELKEEITELSEYSEEKWQSEEVQEKYNNVKKKAKDLFDFIFNGKEINGITFKDLSEDGKQIAKEGFYELDSYIELLVPNYKERFHNWTIDKGADAKEKLESLKEWYNDYKDEVEKEYETRQKSKK